MMFWSMLITFFAEIDLHPYNKKAPLFPVQYFRSSKNYYKYPGRLLSYVF